MVSDEEEEEEELENFVKDKNDRHRCTKVHGYAATRKKENYVTVLDRWQVLAWAVILFSVAMLAALHLPMLPYPMDCIFGVVMPAGATIVFLTKLAASLTQASDAAVFGARRLSYEEYKRNCRAAPHPHPGIDRTSLLFCSYCHVWVGKEVNHCHYCNKCVYDFDHHCKWLNSCVGARNYYLFALFTSSTCAVLLIQMALGIFLFVKSFSEEDTYRDRWYSVYDTRSDGSYNTWRVLMVVTFTLQLPVAAFLVNLLGFHLWLQFKTELAYSSVPIILPSCWDGTLNQLGITSIVWDNAPKNVVEVEKGSQFDVLGVKPGWNLVSVTYTPEERCLRAMSRDDWKAISEELHGRLSYDVDVVFNFTRRRPMSTFDYLMKDTPAPEPTEPTEVDEEAQRDRTNK
eukprot:TRINITY_DN2159_c0_g1_i9.p1 TRINITY_DN2159_c0_g1~~TRINITY_DN2159_c0_g1_i9.p1  ORF type:complete len:418 (+),score=66.81 TRINITY_DN2159_c0_g1_i9:54-1256(+)